MTLDDITKILIAGTSLCLGAYLTALRAKINSVKTKNRLHYAFYAVTVLFFLAALGTAIFYNRSLFFEKTDFKPNWYAVVVIILCLAATITLFVFTRRNLSGKYQYKSVELDPIVNKFTSNADKNNIKLLAGDINFFGNSPQEMERSSQYNCLRNANFRRIEILCIKPQKTEEKIRYGKIVSDLPQVVLRYYNPPKADLNLRGRLKTLNNVAHLLMYNKVESGIYEAVVTDTANSSGALYEHLWNLIWDLGESPAHNEINEYKSLFRN